MSVLSSFLEKKAVHLYRESDWLKADRLSPFVWSDVFLREMSPKPHQMLVHLWPLEKTVILGMLDKRLPYLADGLEVFDEAGYHPVVRNIGGLAVVADEGILNFSLVFSQVSSPLSIKEGYELMMALVSEMFWDCQQPIEAYEITHSYCPGDYDLSIGGRKIAGLAQRRIKDGILVSIYLSVCGDQASRGQLIHDFYEEAKKGQETQSFYPDVWPESMTTMSEVYSREWTVDEVCQRLVETLEKYALSVSDYHLSQANLESYDVFYQDIAKRNQEVMP